MEMTQLFRVEARLYPKGLDDEDLEKIFYLRESLQEAAILAWERVLMAKGGMVVWHKPNGTTKGIAAFFPRGHPGHADLLKANKIRPNEHFLQIATDIIDPKKIYMTAVKFRITDNMFYPGVYFCGKN